MKKNIIIGASLLIVGIVSGLFLCRSCSTPERVEIVQRDSVVVRDTVKEYYPVEIKTERVDTMRIVVRDTVRIKDTLYMNLQMQRRTYKRDDFYAEVTGYNPRLTYIEVYPETVYVTTEKIKPVTKRNALEFGIEVNYSTMFNIPLHLEYSHALTDVLSVYGYGEYELLRKKFGVGAGTKVAFGW